MIAQVFASTGTGPLPPQTDEQTDEQRKFAKQAMAEGSKFDGNEGCLCLIDPTTGDVLVINLFLDEAAMYVFQAYSSKKIAQAEKLGAKVPAPKMYTEVIVLP
jgi:hypothetical protein